MLSAGCLLILNIQKSGLWLRFSGSCCMGHIEFVLLKLHGIWSSCTEMITMISNMHNSSPITALAFWTGYNEVMQMRPTIRPRTLLDCGCLAFNLILKEPKKWKVQDLSSWNVWLSSSHLETLYILERFLADVTARWRLQIANIISMEQSDNSWTRAN